MPRAAPAADRPPLRAAPPARTIRPRNAHLQPRVGEIRQRGDCRQNGYLGSFASPPQPKQHRSYPQRQYGNQSQPQAEVLHFPAAALSVPRRGIQPARPKFTKKLPERIQARLMACPIFESCFSNQVGGLGCSRHANDKSRAVIPHPEPGVICERVLPASTQLPIPRCFGLRVPAPRALSPFGHQQA